MDINEYFNLQINQDTLSNNVNIYNNLLWLLYRVFN